MWLNNVSGGYLVIFTLLLIGQQGLGNFFRHRPLASYWLEDFAGGTPMAIKTFKRTPLILREAPAASQSTFIIDQFYSMHL
jgi:hypothetical protein